MGVTAAGCAVMWCGHCEEPVRRAGGGAPLGQVVHAGTGDELCADGQHAAAPTGVNPELAEVARRVMADYPEYEVSVHFGFLFRAVPRGPLTPVHVEAETEEELRRGIGNQITMRRLAGGHAEHREAASRAVREAARNRLLDIPGTVR